MAFPKGQGPLEPDRRMRYDTGAMSESDHIHFVGVEPPPPRSPRPPRRRAARSVLAPAGPSAEAAQANAFLLWLLERCGLDAAAYRPTTLQRRLPACLRLLRVTSAEQARMALESRPELLPDALSTILIGVSEFFRDRPVFEQLETMVVPTLLGRRKGLRVCSVGCSEGQELYSMAMLLDQQQALASSDLLGIDCRAHAITRAQAGMFPMAALSGLDLPRRQQYFQITGSQATVRPALRQKLQWRLGDAFTCEMPGAWDLVLCRNLTIYLNAEPAERLWVRLAAALRPGGIVVTGKAERPTGALSLVRLATCIYQKRGG